MGFYDLDKLHRQEVVNKISQRITAAIKEDKPAAFLIHFSDEDTYIRKTAYLAVGRVYKAYPAYRSVTIGMLNKLLLSENEKVRQTVVNAAGEIGIAEFGPIEHIMEKALFDPHHSVRNAVIGSMKKMGEKNPGPVLRFAKRFLHHNDKEIRREICHGIELRGRKYPEDILPLLRELQNDESARVRNTLVHVLGQIAYKKGCLVTVVADLKRWENKQLVEDALEEIIDVHERYKDFAVMTQAEIIKYIAKNF